MVFQGLADLVVLVHLAFIIFVVLGGALAVRWRWMPWLHLPAVLWGVLLEFCGWMCPLTPLENWLRRAGGASEYPGGFVERYVLPIVYPAALTREVQFALGLFVSLVNAAFYLRLWRLRRATALTATAPHRRSRSATEGQSKTSRVTHPR